MPRKNYTPQDRASLVNLAERLEATAQIFRATGEMLAQKEIELVQVTDFKTAMRAMKSIESFGHVTREAFYEEMAAQKKYRGPDRDDAPKPRVKKGQGA